MTEVEKLKHELEQLRLRCHPSARELFDGHQWGLLMIVPVDHKPPTSSPNCTKDYVNRKDDEIDWDINSACINYSPLILHPVGFAVDI